MKKETDIKEKILEFSKFENNWNENGAEAFSKKVIENALFLENFLYISENYLIPEIFLTVTGNLQIEYEKEDDYLEIQIRKDGYEFFEVINNQEYNFNLTLNECYEIINLIKLFYNPKIEKACLFTGAFNPPTIAHYHMIESANNEESFDYIIFAISNQKFLDKKQRKLGDYAYTEKQRLEMILTMTCQLPNVLIFGVEQGYTYEVLCAVKEKYQCKDLYFALGSDKLQEIDRWGFHDKLLKEICFYVLKREDSLDYIENKCKELFENTKYVIGQDNEKFKQTCVHQSLNKSFFYRFKS